MSSGGGDYYGLRKGWRRPENPPGGRGTRELLQSGEGRSGWQETQRGLRTTGAKNDKIWTQDIVTIRKSHQECRA